MIIKAFFTFDFIVDLALKPKERCFLGPKDYLDCQGLKTLEQSSFNVLVGEHLVTL